MSTKFTIYGERCSGTNFLEHAISQNFELDITYEYGSKHFFCFNDLNKMNNDNVIVIGIIRNPIYWLNSFSKELYHVPNKNKKLSGFLFNDFFSIDDEKVEKHITSNGNFLFNTKVNNNEESKIILKDLNYITNKKYSNIFELRKVKNDFLMNIMTKYKNYILINYESLLYNYDETLNTIKKKFNLTPKTNTYKKITQYKKAPNYNFVQQRLITFQPELIKIIWKVLDREQEEKLGYIENDDNSIFKKK